MNSFLAAIKNKLNPVLFTDVLACDKILNGFIFDLDAITPCCEMSHNGELNISLYDHTGYKDLIERKIQLIKNINDDKNHICRKCYRIRKYDQIKNKDFNTTTISFSFDKTCNLRCSYCFMSSPETRKFLVRNTQHKQYVMQKIIDFLNEVPKGTLNSIIWTGGEPFLMPDFDDFYLKLLKLKTYIIIATNLTHYKEIVRPKKNPYHIYILCSIDSGTPETYFKIKGKDYFNIVTKNITKYCSIENSSVYIKYIFCQQNNNRKEIDNFIKIMKQCGVQNICISLDRFINKPLSQELIENMKYFIHEGEKNNLLVHDLIQINIEDIIK